MPRYRIAQTVSIDSPPQRVYEYLVDFRTWTTWSPWLISEPDARVFISENAHSQGSTYRWQGTVVGEGEIEHLRLHPTEHIEHELRFVKPFRSIARTAFHIVPSEVGSTVTWTMDGKLPWFLFWMIPMIKTFVSMDFRRGLNMIKDWLETGSIPSKLTIHGRVPMHAIRMAGIPGSCPVEEIGKSLEDALAQATAEFQKQRLPMQGQVISVYEGFDMKAGRFEFNCGYLLPASTEVVPGGALKVWSTPAGEAFHVEHVGSYRHLGNGWSVANQWVRYKKLKQKRCGTFEIYRNTPLDTPETDLKTDLYLPLK